ncbi:MAG: caspase family protein [Leptospiraceae bacterium]|nr:caspase family protein [Leptospiraceae bacterium]
MLLTFFLFSNLATNQLFAGPRKKGIKVLSEEEGNSGQRFAIIVGVNDYIDIGISDLTKARNDAKALAKLLQNQGQFNKVLLLTDDADPGGKIYPTKDNILARVSDLASSANPDDMILFFFSGHGITNEDGKGFIVPVDAEQKDIANSSVSIDEIVSLISNQEKSLLLLDACRDKVYKTKNANQNPLQTDRYNKARLAATFYSTQSGYFSFEDDESDYGVFTRFLLEGLEGKADENHDLVISFTEIENYVQNGVTGWATKNQKQQKPSTEVHGEKFGDLGLTVLDSSEKSLVVNKSDATKNARYSMLWRSTLISGWGQWYGKDYGFDPGTQKLKSFFFLGGTILLGANLYNETKNYNSSKSDYNLKGNINSLVNATNPFLSTEGLATYTIWQESGVTHKNFTNRANLSIYALGGFFLLNILDVLFMGNISVFNPMLKEKPTEISIIPYNTNYAGFMQSTSQQNKGAEIIFRMRF